MNSDIKKIIDHPATNFIAFDPSQNYTGWVAYKPAEHKITSYDCIRASRLLAGRDFSGVMEKREAFQIAYAQALHRFMKMYDPQHSYVIMEKPIGSQSAKAAWALAMASQGVTSASVMIFRKKPITYSERKAKMHTFGVRTVEKAMTDKHMWNYWLGQGIQKPEQRWINENRTAELRNMREAVADAMLILNYHLHKLTQDDYELDV